MHKNVFRGIPLVRGFTSVGSYPQGCWLDTVHLPLPAFVASTYEPFHQIHKQLQCTAPASLISPTGGRERFYVCT